MLGYLWHTIEVPAVGRAETVVADLKEAAKIGHDAGFEAAKELFQGDCQFNCRANRKEDFIAGWMSGQENESAKEHVGRCKSRHEAFDDYMKGRK